MRTVSRAQFFRNRNRNWNVGSVSVSMRFDIGMGKGKGKGKQIRHCRVRIVGKERGSSTVYSRVAGNYETHSRS